MTKIKIHNPIFGVPITFLGQYNSEQFDMVGLASSKSWANYTDILKSIGFNPEIKYGGGLGVGIINKKGVYSRVLIRRK